MGMSGVPSDAVVLLFLTLYIDRGADEKVRLSEERGSIAPRFWCDGGIVGVLERRYSFAARGARWQMRIGLLNFYRKIKGLGTATPA